MVALTAYAQNYAENYVEQTYAVFFSDDVATRTHINGGLRVERHGALNCGGNCFQKYAQNYVEKIR